MWLNKLIRCPYSIDPLLELLKRVVLEELPDLTPQLVLPIPGHIVYGPVLHVLQREVVLVVVIKEILNLFILYHLQPLKYFLLKDDLNRLYLMSSSSAMLSLSVTVMSVSVMWFMIIVKVMVVFMIAFMVIIVM